MMSKREFDLRMLFMRHEIRLLRWARAGLEAQRILKEQKKG